MRLCLALLCFALLYICDVYERALVDLTKLYFIGVFPHFVFISIFFSYTLPLCPTGISFAPITINASNAVDAPFHSHTAYIYVVMAAPDSIRQFAYLNEHDVCLVSRGLSLSRMIAAFVGIQVIMERSYGALHLLRVLLSHATGSHTGTLSGNGSDGSKSRSQSYSPFSADIRNL